jgi:hypothetical protein
MLDTGSIACSLSKAAEQRMLAENISLEKKPLSEPVILVGLGGETKCMYEVDLDVYGISCLVPVLIVPGQHDDLILGTNLIKHLMHQMKGTDEYWSLISECASQPSSAGEYFLNMMTNLTCWQSEEMPRKIGTVKLNQAVTLLAKQEQLVWGGFPTACQCLQGAPCHEISWWVESSHPCGATGGCP